jgi:hypothetical protein
MNIIFLSDPVNENDLGLYDADEENLFVSEDYKRLLSHMHYSKADILVSVLNTYPNIISNYFSFDVDLFIQRLKNLGIYNNQITPPRTFGDSI